MGKGKILVVIFFLIILALGIVAGVWFWVYQNNDEPIIDEPVELNDEPEAEVTTEMEPPARIEADHRFTDGLHTVSGRIDVPNNCFNINLEPMVSEGEPEVVMLEFSSEFSEGRVCTEATISRSFREDFQAGAEAQIEARFDNAEVELVLNLIEDRPDLEPEPEPAPDEFIKE